MTDPATLETCRRCGAVAPSGRAALHCPGCGVKVRGLLVSISPESAFVGEESTHARVTVENAGQMSVQIEAITLAGRGAPVEIMALDSMPLKGGVTRQYEVELASHIEPGAYTVVVRTVGNLTQRAHLSLLQAPMVTLSGDATHEGGALVQLSQVPTSLTETAPRANRWLGELSVKVTPLNDQTITVQSVVANVLGLTAAGLSEARTIAGPQSLGVRLDCDQSIADSVGVVPAAGRVEVRIAGHEQALVRVFHVVRRRSAKIAADPSDLARVLARRRGSDGLYVTWGMGHELAFEVGIGNHGDLPVQVAGPVTAGAQGISILHPAQHHGTVLRPVSVEPQLRLDVVVRPDDVDLDTLEEDGGAMKLPVELNIPLVDPDRPQEPWVATVLVRDLLVRRATIDYDTELFVDLGTTNTCVAMVGRENVPVMLDVDRTDALGFLYPSLVQLREHALVETDYAAACRFGALNRELMYVNTKAYLASAVEFKPYIGRHPPFRQHYIDYGHQARAWDSEQIATIFLRHVFDQLKKNELNRIPSAIYLSAPVNFTVTEKEALRRITTEAFRSTPFPGPVKTEWMDVETSVFCSEPTALLISLLYGSPPRLHMDVGDELTIAIFDFGGGTTDVLVTRVSKVLDPDTEDETFTLNHLAKDMDKRGGELLTREIGRAMWPRVSRAIREDLDRRRAGGMDVAPHIALLDTFRPPTNRAEVGALGETHKPLFKGLLKVAELSKINFGDVAGHMGTFALAPDDGAPEVVLNMAIDELFDAEAIEGVVDDFVRPKLRSLERIEQKLIGGGQGAFDKVYLAGNSSRLSLVTTLAATLFGDRVIPADADAKEGVVKGMGWSIINNILPEELGDDRRNTPSYCLKSGKKLYERDEPCVGTFLSAFYLKTYPMDAFGEQKDTAVATFRMARAVRGRREKLQVTLRVHVPDQSTPPDVPFTADAAKLDQTDPDWDPDWDPNAPTPHRARPPGGSGRSANVRFTLDIAEPDQIDPPTGKVLSWKHRCTLQPE